MSGWTSFRNKVEGIAAPVASAIGVGPPLMMIGSGAAALGGLTGLLGGGAPMAGGMGGGMMSQISPSAFGTPSSTDQTGQFGSLMDMLAQKYNNQGQVSPTGSAGLSNQGLA